MPTEIRKVDVNLEGLLKVLGDNLYSSPVVSIRELIQNAYDACIRRKVEAKWQKRPKIQIKVNPNKGTVEIKDNGSGLTDQEIIRYLATIGDGYTRILRQKTADENAVGYFGLGFLTAYVVAKQVDFITTSYQDKTKGWKFSSKGGQSYQLKEIAPKSIGTTVKLKLKDEFLDLADADFIALIIRKYCCLLPVDIYLNNQPEAVNRIEIPWQLAAENHSKLRLKKSALNFAELFDHSFEPISAIPITGNANCKINGLLWIQDGAYYASSDNRITTIFIRSMHITDECKDLLPEWAGFIGCVIDTPILTPTASRESVKDDLAFQQVKDLIKKRLIAYLTNLSSTSETTWQRIMARHNQSLLGAAVSDQALFSAMQSQLSIPTSEGELTIGQITQRSGDTCLRISMEESGGYEHLISKSMGIPIIYGYRYGVTRFCHLVSESSELQLLTLGANENNEALFPRKEVTEEIETILLEHFKLANAKTIISEYQPESLPLIIVYDQDVLLKKRIESEETNRHIGLATLMLAKEFTDKITTKVDCYLYINMNNLLIQHFATLDKNKQSALAQSLLDITHLLSVSDGEGGRNNLSAIESLNHSLLTLVEAH